MEYSVLIRSKDSESTIGRTLRSAINQSAPPSAIILVDNSSTDNTVCIARELAGDLLKVVNYPAEEFNYSKAINIGMQAVETPLALILSSHVSLRAEDSVENTLKYFAEDEDLIAVTLGTISKKNGLVKELTFPNSLFSSNTAQIIRYSNWLEESFDSDIPTAEDKLWEKYWRGRGKKFAFVSNSVEYKNPYANFKKREQEAYTMAKHVDSGQDLTRKILSDLRVLLIKILRLKFAQAWEVILLLLVRLNGFFIGKKEYSSVGYRKN